MKKLLLLSLLLCCAGRAWTQTPRPRPTPKMPVQTPTPVDPLVKEIAELDALAQLPPAERVDKLKAFIEAKPDSPNKLRANEALVSAHAAWGDELLKAGTPDKGLEQFHLAVQESPAEISDLLYARVLSVLPSNLYVRGQREAAVALAQDIEKLVANNPQRLLPFVTFYLSLEDAANAERLATEVVKLAPESAAAHQALGAARHIGLHLESAAVEYQAALALDPTATAARRGLADLLRANGTPAEALPLYRQQLEADPKDRLARAGLVLALLDAGQREEGDKELAAALTDEPRNLPLLAGAAYWYAAHGENSAALDFAQRAVQLEPRYTWGQIALARALLAQNQPFAALGALSYAQQYGRFPTLSYELATALASVGLYEEAAEELSRSFGIKYGQIGTLLAGRQESFRDNFTDLLAPERRAGLFQAKAADTAANARQLKNLLFFYRALHPISENTQRDENAAGQEAQAFGTGTDGMATYRQLYAANRLRRLSLAPAAVTSLMEAAPLGVENALDQPYTVVAVMSDDWQQISRNNPAFANPQPNINTTQRTALSRVIRGRIEELAGWAFLSQNNTDEALIRFRRALSVLPENTSWWRSTQWQMGLALEIKGKSDEALAAYLKGYNPSAPDAVRRAVITRLYRQVKGSDEGLDKLIGPAPVASVAAPVPSPESTPATISTPPANTEPTATPEPTPTPQALPEVPPFTPSLTDARKNESLPNKDDAAPGEKPDNSNRPRRIKP